jgi:hypothetical protein
VGNSVSKDTSAFNKIQTVSKLSSNAIEFDTATNNSLFRKVNNLYINPNTLNNNSYFYGTVRQHNLTSSASTLPSYSTLMDKKSFDKFFMYSSSSSKIGNSNQQYSVTQLNKPAYNSSTNNNNTAINFTQPLNVLSLLNSAELENHNSYPTLDFSKSILSHGRLTSMNTLTDKQNVVNPLKLVDSSKKISTKSNNSPSYFDELLSSTQNNFFS